MRNVEINVIVGYAERNVSVRCLTFLMECIRKFNIRFVNQLSKDIFDTIDKKACKEYFDFLLTLKQHGIL